MKNGPSTHPLHQRQANIMYTQPSSKQKQRNKISPQPLTFLFHTPALYSLQYTRLSPDI